MFGNVKAFRAARHAIKECLSRRRKVESSTMEKIMNSLFIAVAIAMTLGAIQFVLWPAIARKTAQVNTRHWGVMAAIAVIPALAFSVYATTGNPEAINVEPADNSQVALRPTMAATGQANKGAASISSLVDGLAEKLAKDPGDGKGWLLLAKSYKHLERQDDFAMAYQHARELGYSEADLDDYLAGLSADTREEPVIRGRVTIDDSLRDNLDGAATVFIIARASAGSPAPLAVLKTTVQDLPYDFEMSDSNAMIKSMPLSAVDSIVLSAKISPTGEALNTLPELGAASGPISMGHGGVIEIGISR
jgi:hypothetical protein